LESPRTVQKLIAGQWYRYDRWLDIISCGPPRFGPMLDRTQVDRYLDLCLELTTSCNLACHNCFSDSSRSKPGTHAAVPDLIAYIRARSHELIRISVTGGEPFLHPHLESLLAVPAQIPDCGFVIATNGTVRPDLDDPLVVHGWLVAISLHGSERAHNAYTLSRTFTVVSKRIETLSRRTPVHIYTVVHDSLSDADIDWLFNFRDETGARFLRFITPRAHGRFVRLRKRQICTYIRDRLDAASALKSTPSRTLLRSVAGVVRPCA
jgi:molybdenum cofactor biosynthesis enzyme MoaA